MRTFRDKVAVVTGAGGTGIGNALVVELAQQGARVAFCDVAGLRKTEDDLARFDCDYLSATVDITDRGAVNDFIDEVLDRFGQVDLLINNAGIALGDRSFAELTEADFDKITDVNYWGVVHTTRRCYEALLASPEAAIVNISSAQGILALPYLVPYCTTKFAVRGFSDALRAEHRIRGVSNVAVHTVHPGRVATDITLHADYQGTGSERFHRHLQRGPSPAEAATIILRGVRRGTARIFISDGRMHDLLARVLPTANTRLIRLEMRRQGVQIR